VTALVHAGVLFYFEKCFRGLPSIGFNGKFEET